MNKALGKDMKRILLLIPALNAGGAERVMVTLANEWSKENDITLMVFNNGNCFYHLNNEVHLKALNIMPRKKGLLRKFSIPFVELLRLNAIYSEIKKGKYNFILSFCFTTNFFASMAALFLKKEKILISERNDPYKYSGWQRRIVNLLYRRSDVIICQNKVVKEYFIKNGFKNNLIILPNPVNFTDIPTKRPDYISPEIVTVGRLNRQKNHRLLIEAFDEIKELYQKYTVKIYGIGLLEEELKDLIIERNLESRVFLMGTKKRVMFEVNKSSIFVLTSDFEGFPNVLIEAMATGLPVVSSDFNTGIASELIKSEDNGYLFEVGNKKDLVLKLKKILDRENDFIKMGERNRIMAEQYRDKIIAKKWIREIDKIKLK